MEVVGSVYTQVSNRFQRGVIGGGISRRVKAENHDLGVVMADVKVIGQMDNTIDHTFESTNRVYDVGGVAPAMNTCGGGGLQPKILETKQLGFMDSGTGKQIRKSYESGQIQESRHNMTELEPRTDDVSNTLTTVQKDNMVLIKQATKSGSIECEVGGCFDASYPESQTRRGRVQDGGNTCPTLTAQNQEIVRIEPQYRIRKLTPRECGRLMGVTDEDIDKMAAVNSNTQLYKQFGNSIVVDVMCAMFKNLNINQL